MKIEQGASSATPAGRYCWLICGLLFFATIINYMDWQILSLIKPILDEQLHWTNEQFGIVNSAFQGAHAIGARRSQSGRPALYDQEEISGLRDDANRVNAIALAIMCLAWLDIPASLDP